MTGTDARPGDFSLASAGLFLMTHESPVRFGSWHARRSWLRGSLQIVQGGMVLHAHLGS